MMSKCNLPNGSVGKESACNAGDPDLNPGMGRSPGGGNGKPLQYSCRENPINSMKRQKDLTLEDETPQVGRCPICYKKRVEAITNSSRKNEVARPKWKRFSTVDV